MKILIAIIIFSVIVIVHELGHFLIAKKNGIVVTEFSVGMGPTIVGFTKGDTKYSLKILPFGGACMMLGQDELSDNEGAFNKKGVWARISTIAAGPIFNFLLAFVLAMFVIGGIGYDPATVTNVAKGYAADQAGLQKGDVITEIDGKNVSIGRDIDVYFQFHPVTSSDPIEVKYTRNGESYTTSIVPTLYKKYMTGISYYQNESKVTLGDMQKDSPAEKIGMRAGDVLTAINGTRINTGLELKSYFEQNPLTEETVKVTFERDGKEKTVEITPNYVGDSYVTGFVYNMARTGKETNPITIVKYSYQEVKFWIKSTVASVGELVKGKLTKDDLAGPVGLVDMIGDSYDSVKEEGAGITFLMMANICIFISANLGVMNLLPIPALDGGRLVFLFIEAIRGKPISQEKEGIVHLVGFVALMLLMVFVLFNDISKIIR